MTITEMYEKLLENAKRPDRELYDRYERAILSDIDTVLEDIEPDAYTQVLPFNHQERMDYIQSRPYQYHSIIQLKGIHEEFIKKVASYRIRKKRS
ncbi:YpoC family protein [Salinicoccus sesuvii]|uniref:YpoC family protein n=1 Tax=Salinicoccus sesuvii TaxID=868281 RepID=A0ABV7N873_9STAP